MKNASTLIFDLDGTLSDPSLGIGRCINYALAAHGFAEITKEQIAAMIGPPLDESFRTLCPASEASVIASLIATYRERYADVGYAENQLYPGVAEGLQALSAKGVAMGVCTSKPKRFADKILAMFGLSPHFRFVDGGDVGIKKREQLAGLLRSHQIDRSAIMIGDRAVDITSAKANGLRSVGVLWGFGGQPELREAGADLILSEISELGKLGRQQTVTDQA